MHRAQKQARLPTFSQTRVWSGLRTVPAGLQWARGVHGVALSVERRARAARNGCGVCMNVADRSHQDSASSRIFSVV